MNIFFFFRLEEEKERTQSYLRLQKAIFSDRWKCMVESSNRKFAQVDDYLLENSWNNLYLDVKVFQKYNYSL